MRPIRGYPLWLGHAGDARDLQALFSSGVASMVDLALNEPPAPVPRELVYCRFPLLDGSGNAPWLLRAAVNLTTILLWSGAATLVCCSAGMSRSLCIAAAAIAKARGSSPEEALAFIAQSGPADVSPALWNDVRALVT